MTIRFKNENLVLARGVCNSMFGNYSISGQNCIKVSDLIQTMIYCGNTWEKLYFDLIHDLASYNVYNNSLILRTSSNIDMHFKAE